jgi:vacuolar-type H+-ATPase subunit F/Vma7
MNAPVFIGDEISAAGYRLAGVRVRSPVNREQLLAGLHWATGNCNLIILSSDCAALLTPTELEQLLVQLQPPLLVVPYIRAKTSAEQLALRLREKLGVLE